MIEVVKQLKTRLGEVRSYLELLADPLLAEKEFDGVYAVRDGNNGIVQGALRYGAGADGPSVAILGGIHMNEMAGVFALLKFHDRWSRGVRPKGGNIYVATGKIERALEFVDLVLESDTVSKELWSSFRATRDHFNFNRIPFDILTREISNDFERQAHRIVKYVLGPVEGNVLDLHNTSEDAPPMVTIFMKKGETPEMGVSRMNSTGVTRGLPIRHYIVWKPGPYNGMESIRSVVDSGSGTIPLLIENGGGSNPESFENADLYTQIWLRNVKGMEPDEEAIGRESKEIDRTYYAEARELYHPAVKPDDYSYLDEESLGEAKKDTLVLMRDWRVINGIVGWSEKARHALDKLVGQELPKDRLDNFMPIKEGDTIAIGLKTGLEIRSPQDGVVLMVGSSPVIEPEYRETFANIGVVLQ